MNDSSQYFSSIYREMTCSELAVFSILFFSGLSLLMGFLNTRGRAAQSRGKWRNFPFCEFKTNQLNMNFSAIAVVRTTIVENKVIIFAFLLANAKLKRGFNWVFFFSQKTLQLLAVNGETLKGSVRDICCTLSLHAPHQFKNVKNW